MTSQTLIINNDGQSQPINRINQIRMTVRKLTKITLTAYPALMMAYLVMRLVIPDAFWPLAFLNAFAIYLFLPLIVALPLATLWRMKPVTVANLAMLGILMLWTAPYFINKQHNVAQGTPLKVITFNMYSHNLTEDDVATWLREQNADVVLVQETTWNIAHYKVPKLLDMYPYQMVPDWSASNFILSRYPFITQEEITPAVPAEFYGLRVTINWQSQQIALYNVHMPVPFSDKNPRLRLPERIPSPLRIVMNYDESTRNANIRTLIKRLQAEPLPYIVTGDFNMSDHSLIYNELAAQSGDTFLEVGYGFGKSWPHSDTGLMALLPPVIRIDYVWHSKQFEPITAQQGPSLGSDHLPLVTMFNLRSDMVEGPSTNFKVKQ